MIDTPWPVAATLFVLAAALVISAVTDLLRRTIYDAVTLPALALELLLLAYAGGRGQLLSSIGGVALLWLPLFLGSFVDAAGGRLRIRWAPERAVFGEGDAKLMAVAGAAAGWPSAVLVLVWVSLATGVQAALALLWARLRGREKPVYVPMGLAIAAGTLLAWTVGVP